MKIKKTHLHLSIYKLTVLKPLLFFLFFLMFRNEPVYAQTCTSKLYLKDLKVNTPRASFLLLLPGGGTILGGTTFGQLNHVSIIKTNPDGDVVWNKQIAFSRYAALTEASLSPDYKIVIAHGNSIALLDTNGVFVNAATVTVPFGVPNLQDMKVDDSGNVIALYSDVSGVNSFYLLIKFSADLSSILWTRRFGGYAAYFSSFTVDENNLFVCGFFGTQINDTYDGTLLCFSNNTGQLTQQVSYSLDGFATSLITVHKTLAGYLLEGFYQPTGTAFSTTTHAVIRLDTTLQPVRAVRFTSIQNNKSLFILPDANGGFYGTSQVAFGTFFYCNSLDSVLWTRGIAPSKGFGVEQFAKSATNLYALESSCWTLYKTDMNAQTGGCNEFTDSYQSIPLVPAVVPKGAISTSTIIASHSSDNFAVVDQPFQTVNFCSYTSVCSSVDIVGENTFCTSGEAVKFTARRNAACRLPVQWKVAGAGSTQEPLTDSTLSIKFLQSGTYQLIASLPDDCLPIADTLSVTVSVTTHPPLNLGPDKSLCPGNTIILNARKGYASYLWQDGSTDSTFTVTQPGLYHVTTTDACGAIFKDSVMVAAAPSIPFDVGPDRTKCNSDTLHLSAPAGFLNYMWSNNYNISSTTGQHVIVNPLIDTAYYIRAEKSPGCFAYDTVRIIVNQSLPIDLGPDKSFCVGDSAVFTAGSGFQTYGWSNGQATPQIVVKTAGQYSVIGTTNKGCKSYDTIKVTSVHPLPVVSLDKNPAICLGASKTLNAGSFVSYQWNTGTTTPILTVNDIGMYAVAVVDVNGCKGGDTTAITTLYPVPKGVLPLDTAICSYGSLQLKPSTSFSTYLWSTGSISPSLTITQPGLYWLQVQDNNRCVGRDSILVAPKDCLKGFYAPSAFTPNGDNRNDVFRPMLFGNVKKYRFTVYNRWGAIVFETKDLQKGWDGKIAGILQQSNAFVWTCSYEFEGDAPKTEKGTVTVIR